MSPRNRSKAKQKLERRARRQDIDRQQHSEAKPRPDSHNRACAEERDALWFNWLLDKVFTFAERNQCRPRGILQQIVLVEKRFLSGNREKFQNALLQLSRLCEGSSIDSAVRNGCPEPAPPFHQLEERLRRLVRHTLVEELDKLRPHEYFCDLEPRPNEKNCRI